MHVICCVIDEIFGSKVKIKRIKSQEIKRSRDKRQETRDWGKLWNYGIVGRHLESSKRLWKIEVKIVSENPKLEVEVNAGHIAGQRWKCKRSEKDAI